MDAQTHMVSKPLEECLLDPLAHMRTNTLLPKGMFWIVNLYQDIGLVSCISISNPWVGLPLEYFFAMPPCDTVLAQFYHLHLIF